MRAWHFNPAGRAVRPSLTYLNTGKEADLLKDAKDLFEVPLAFEAKPLKTSG